MRLHHGLGRLACGVDGRREAAGEAQIEDGQAVCQLLLKDLHVAAGRDGGGGNAHIGVLAHELVEVVRVAGLPHVVEKLALGCDVTERDDPHAQTLGHSRSKVCRGVDENLAGALPVISPTDAGDVGRGIVKLYGSGAGLVGDAFLIHAARNLS